MTETTYTFSNYRMGSSILGTQDKFLKVLVEQFPCKVVCRGDVLHIQGEDDDVRKFTKVLDELVYLYEQGGAITAQQVKMSVNLVREDKTDVLHNMFGDTLNVSARGKSIKPKTEGQQHYVDSIRKNTITFGIGPAGTGKTFLAVTLAAFYLKNRDVEKIILTRPAVEAGEKLGYLPGDLQEKVDPYLRPLYDALHEMFGAEQVQQFMLRGIIEVAPLAYMRGRTLEKAFVILDEAQNTTPEQMKMFLTRLGNNSKMVINGDITQVDLPGNTQSGLIEAKNILENIKDIKVVQFTEKDVVRHDLVSKIIKAYESNKDKLEANRNKLKNNRR